MLLCVGECTL